MASVAPTTGRSATCFGCGRHFHDVTFVVEAFCATCGGRVVENGGSGPVVAAGALPIRAPVILAPVVTIEAEPEPTPLPPPEGGTE